MQRTGIYIDEGIEGAFSALSIPHVYSALVTTFTTITTYPRNVKMAAQKELEFKGYAMTGE